MAIAYFLTSMGQVARSSRLLCFDLGAEFYTWRSEIQEGAKWTWAGFGLSAPFLFTPHPYWDSPFLVVKFARLVTLPPFSFVYVLYHHRYPNASHRFGEKKRISGGESHCSFVDTQPSTIKMNKMGLTASHWMVDLI